MDVPQKTSDHVLVPTSVSSVSAEPSPADPAIPTDSFYVVGVGASAGGLEALEKMFRAMPENTGMAFVIVQHLSPDFKSLMHELLARHTSMPIHRVEDGMPVQPNSLYLIPPKQEMVIANGKLLLTEKDPAQSLSLPIDLFFRSLAKDMGRRAIAVVLSGTGSDGSRGIRDVHEVGGLVIAQSNESAKFDGMPKSAENTGLVDVVVNPEKIPDVLVRYVRDPLWSSLEEADRQAMDETSLEHIFRLLQHRHRIDFSYYKPTTIGRRIERRIQLNHHGDIEEYVRRLQSDPAEVDQLYRDLLIGVTRFFRDFEAFEKLQQDVLPELLNSVEDNQEFRVWVAACATGEEAYSVAILLHELLQQLNRRLNVKIFATDVHQTSLDIAQGGVYPESSLEEMSTERRQRYFQQTELGYQISPQIREMIVFAPHNLVHDAPFTRLHLITCRNLLIYLKSSAQKKVLSLFHFGLKTNGCLFLGASESPGELAAEFATWNERWRMFRKLRDVRLFADFREAFATPQQSERERPLFPGIGGPVSDRRDLIATYDELLDQYMPPAILIERQGHVAQMFAGAGQYLCLADGRLSTNVLDLVDGELRMALAGSLQRAAKLKHAVTCEKVRLTNSAGERYVRLEVKPVVGRQAESKFLVTFQELDLLPENRREHKELIDVGEESRHRVEALEQELRYSKENLQAAVEELETSNEELQATNEELVASNEELQSTNEELHSVNEELYTVNAEYQRKIAELTELTNDMDNLLLSTEVHTLFLDEQLCVRKFTPNMAAVFNLVTHDIGRRIDAFAHNIICERLIDKISDVLEAKEQYEERVRDNRGNHFLMRVLPYRSGNTTDGVVVTLIEISSLVSAQEEVLHERERFERVIAANRDGVWDWPDVTRDDMWWSDSCYLLLGHEPGEFPSRYSEWLNRIHPEDRERVRQTSIPTQEECYVQLHRDFEYRMLHKSGQYRWFRHRAKIDYDESGNPCRMTGSAGDIHARKTAEMQTAQEIRRRDNFVAMLSHELRNPMGAVLNAVEMIQATATENTELRDASRIIARQTKHMARLLDDLLDEARFGQNKIEFRKDIVDLVELVDDVLEATAYEIDVKHQLLHVTVCDGPLHVLADPARIKQAQVNLLSNAAKYTPDSQDIWYELEREGEFAVITVRDSGEGIPQDMLESIFDLFVQSDSTLARSSGGMGVGLSLARRIVEAHQGSIFAESEGPGQGSTFRIRIPLTSAARPRQTDESLPSFDKCKLLLVEDNDDARFMLAKTLRMRGFDVIDAADAQQALAVIRSFQPDVAVIDIGLPVMDGYQLAREIRQIDDLDGILLVALTGYGRTNDRQTALLTGFDAHLVKPLNPLELFELISRKLTHKSPPAVR